MYLEGVWFMDRDKYVDESWKESVEREKEGLLGVGAGQQKDEPKIHVEGGWKPEEDEGQNDSKNQIESEQNANSNTPDAEPNEMEINFLNYISSLGYQALIFLGEIPNPMTNQPEKNLPQAKFLIDTLTMLKEKTKGNLNRQEETLLNSSVYELQLKYVEHIKQDA